MEHLKINESEHNLVCEINNLDDLIRAIRQRNAFKSESSSDLSAIMEQDLIIDDYMRKIPVINRSVFVQNVFAFLKERNMKMSELEQILGVSTGYISRLTKPGTDKKLSIDLVWKIAQLFGKTLYELIQTDHSELTSHEQYLISFINKLCADTTADKIMWNVERSDDLNRLDISSINRGEGHPLFSYERFFSEDESGYSREMQEVVMVSKSFGCNTCINGNCYNLRMKNGVTLYLMNLSKDCYNIRDADSFAKEMWIWKPDEEKVFLCGTQDGDLFANLIENLYKTVSEIVRHPHIDEKTKEILDAFMNDDLSDDSEDSATTIPFF